MKVSKAIEWFFVFTVALALILFVGMQMAFGSDCRGNQPCNTTSIPIVVQDGDTDTFVGGTESLALGFGGANFDVDIAQCLASKSRHWLFGAYADQKLTQNLHCMGLAYMAAGMPDAAKYVLCDAENAPLAGMPNCPGFLEKPVTEAPAPPDSAFEDHFEEEEQHEQQLMEQQMLISDMQSKLESLSKVRSTTRTIVEEKPFLTEEKRAALREIVDE